MRSVHLYVSYVPGAHNNREILPRAAIKSYFRKFNTNVNVSDKPRQLPGDPFISEGMLTAYRNNLKRRFESEPAGSGVCILASRFPPKPSATGVMFSRHRIASAIFLDSGFLSNRNKSSVFQVAVHEIGHMLNLLHESPNRNYLSAMVQTRFRQDSQMRYEEAWQRARLEASQVQGDTLGPIRIVEKHCFPLSRFNRRFLRQSSDNIILPGVQQQDFRGRVGIEDIANLAVELDVVPSRDEFIVGGHFAFDVVVRNRSAGAIVLEDAISLNGGGLTLRIVRPDGSEYTHRPRILLCGSPNVTLPAGSSVCFPGAIFDGVNGAVFPFPGRYRFMFSLDPVLGPFHDIEVAVQDRTDGLKFDSGFSQFLSDGAPLARSGQSKRLNSVMRGEWFGKDPSIAHMAFYKGQQTVRRSLRERLLREACGPHSARAVRHAAICTQAMDVASDVATLAEFVLRMQDKLDPKLDVALVRELETLRQQGEREK